jgi:transposase
MPKIYVGVDISKYKFDACIKNDENQILMKPKTYDQNMDDMHRFMHDIDNARTDESTKVLIGMESTARYHRNLMGYLLKHGYDVTEFNPIEIFGLRKGRIRNTKTDKIDAEIITSALMLDTIENTKRYLKDQDHIRMRELGLLHNRLTVKSSRLKIELREALTVLCPGYDSIFTNVLGKTSKEILRKSIKLTKLFDITPDEVETIMKKNFMSSKRISDKPQRVMRSFEKSTMPEYYMESLVIQVRFILDQHDLLLKQLNMLEARIKRAIRDIDPISMSIPGMGPLTCAVVLGTYGNMNRFTGNNAVTAYAGLDPRVFQSGKSINRTGRISKRGNRYLRRYLMNAALVAIRHNPVIKKKYSDLMKRGKHHNVALTACARKLLLIIYSVEKNQKRFYVPKYISEQ